MQRLQSYIRWFPALGMLVAAPGLPGTIALIFSISLFLRLNLAKFYEYNGQRFTLFFFTTMLWNAGFHFMLSLYCYANKTDALSLSIAMTLISLLWVAKEFKKISIILKSTEVE